MSVFLFLPPNAGAPLERVHRVHVHPLKFDNGCSAPVLKVGSQNEKPNYSDLLSEIATVLKLILLLPATNAQSERVFSSLRRVKTYLRNSMSQGKLNHVMLMNVHKEETKKVSLEEVAEEFISKNERRRADFSVKNYI